LDKQSNAHRTAVESKCRNSCNRRISATYDWAAAGEQAASIASRVERQGGLHGRRSVHKNDRHLITAAATQHTVRTVNQRR